jgi:MFS family permease
MAVPPPEGPAVVPLRRNRDFLLFWLGQVLSTAGTQATTVAFPLLVLAVTGSPLNAGAVGFAQTLPFIVWFLPAGALVDRLDRKRVMLACEAVRFAVMASVAVALFTGRFSMAHILIAAFVEGSALVFFELAEAAALPHIVPQRQLPTALAQNQARQQAANLSGQPLGGALFGLGRSLPFVFDALSYLVSAATLLSIRPDFQEERGDDDRSMAGQISAGISWLWHQPFLRSCSAIAAVANFVMSALTLTVIVRVQDLGGGPTVVGLVMSALGVGALVGSALAPAVQRRLAGRTILLFTTAGEGLMWALAATAPNPLLLAVAIGAGAAVAPWMNVMVGRYRYALAPDELQGRVLSAFRVLAWGAVPVGAMAAFTLEGIGTTETFLGLAFIMAVLTIGAAVAPSLRNDPLQRLGAPETQPEPETPTQSAAGTEAGPQADDDPATAPPPR